MKNKLKVLLFLCLWISTHTLLMAQSPIDSSLWTIDLDDIVVTAQYAPTDSRNALHDIQTIQRSTLEARGVNNLEQALQQEVGLRIRQDLVLGSSVQLLGLSGQNVKIMIDGVPIIGRQGGNINLSQINMQNVERVEIVEGPLSVGYGTDALAGVINLITRKSQVNANRVGVVFQYETRGERTVQANLGRRLGSQWLLALSGGINEFDGFGLVDSLRYQEWNPKEQKYAEGSLRFLEGGHDLQYRFSVLDENVTNLGEVRRPDFKPYSFDDQYQTLRIDHALNYSGEVAKNYFIQSVLGYNRFRRYKNSYRRNFEPEEEILLEGQQDTSRFSAIQWRTTFASQYDDSPLQFQVGLDLRYDDATGKRIQDSLSSRENFSEIQDYAVFGQVRYQPWNRLELEGGLRYAYNSRYDAPLVPSVHVKYNIDEDWAFRASYGKGFRSPDLKELFFRFIDINHYIIGNPDLLAEQSDNFQVSFHYDHEGDNGEAVSFKIKGFYNRIEQKIGLFEFVETEDGGIAPAIDTTTFRFAYFNQANDKNQGVNLNFGYENGPLLLKTGASLVGYFQPSYESLGVDPFTYAVELNGEITYTVPRSLLRFSLFWRNNDRLITYFPDTNEDGESIVGQRIQDGFMLTDLTVGMPIWENRFRITTGVRNLLDVQTVTVSGGGNGGAHSGSTGTAAVGLGRSFFVRLQVDINW
ncbi:MAG: TonB-dependent receptor [Bacteroidota bacterium]